MKKLILIFLLMISANTVISHPMFSKTPRLDERSKKIEINQKFIIYSEVEIPYPHTMEDWQWQPEDDWKLVSYPSDALELIKKDALAPDGCGGNLLQSWTLKARKSGIFKLDFQRYSEQATVTVTIQPTVMEPVWITLESHWDTKYIKLEDGDDNYILFMGDTLTINAPWQHSSDKQYVWKPEDRWQLITQPNQALSVIKIYDHVWNDNSLAQSWTFTVNQSGSYTLRFKRYSKEVVINLWIPNEMQECFYR